MLLESLTLKSPAFGLDISDLSLKIVKLKRAGQDFDLASFAHEPLAKGIIEEGLVRDEVGLADAIKQALSRVRGEKIRGSSVVVSLPEEKTFLRVIQLPPMTLAELRQTMPFEAENHIPLAVKEVFLDFEVVPPLVNGLDHLDVLLVACPRTVVDAYVHALKLAGLCPLALESEALALARALVKDGVSPLPVLLVDLGASKTNLAVFSGHSLRFSSSLTISTTTLTQALAQGLKISFEEAEKIKANWGLSTVSKVQLLEKTGDFEFEREVVPDQKIFQILSPFLAELVAKIKYFLDFYYSHASHEHILPNQSEIKKIFLVGGGANLKGLDAFLDRRLQMTTVIGNPWVNVLPEPEQRIPQDYLRRSLGFATAIGLALRGMMAEPD